MNYILIDGPSRDALLPFTYTRPVAEIRVGILTIREKWEKFLNTEISTQTEAYLSKKYPLKEASQNIIINACFLPSEKLVNAIKKLEKHQALFYKGQFIAFFGNVSDTSQLNFFKGTEFTEDEVLTIENTWDIFSKNDLAIRKDFEILTKNRKSLPLPQNVQAISSEHIFIEENTELTFCTLNASKGPIYIGRNSVIMEGSHIRGPFAILENSAVKMGAKIYGATTVGPHCTVGGEIKNSVLFGYSNKGHEGYIGDTVIGEWCNLGADTNTSNLKNNYASVRLWDYQEERFATTGLQFCGLMMGDHSKCGINTMFNTGTVVGVNANIFGSGFPRNFIPSYSWGGSKGFTTYRTKKAFEVCDVVMKRKNVPFNKEDQEILEHIFQETIKFRTSYE